MKGNHKIKLESSSFGFCENWSLHLTNLSFTSVPVMAVKTSHQPFGIKVKWLIGKLVNQSGARPLCCSDGGCLDSSFLIVMGPCWLWPHIQSSPSGVLLIPSHWVLIYFYQPATAIMGLEHMQADIRRWKESSRQSQIYIFICLNGVFPMGQEINKDLMKLWVWELINT